MRAAALHVKCLPGTLTSQRGVRTVVGIYRHLVRRGHAAHLALDKNKSGDDNMAGGLIVIRHARAQSTGFVLIYRPWSWLVALRAIGVHEVFSQLSDLVRRRNAAKQLDPHDYIAAVYIAETSRRLGLARQLIELAIADAKTRGVGIAVDTTLSNESAKNLYETMGFNEFYRTNVSVLFVKAVN